MLTRMFLSDIPDTAVVKAFQSVHHLQIAFWGFCWLVVVGSFFNVLR